MTRRTPGAVSAERAQYRKGRCGDIVELTQAMDGMHGWVLWWGVML